MAAKSKDWKWGFPAAENSGGQDCACRARDKGRKVRKARRQMGANISHPLLRQNVPEVKWAASPSGGSRGRARKHRLLGGSGWQVSEDQGQPRGTNGHGSGRAGGVRTGAPSWAGSPQGSHVPLGPRNREGTRLPADGKPRVPSLSPCGWMGLRCSDRLKPAPAHTQAGAGSVGKVHCGVGGGEEQTPRWGGGGRGRSPVPGAAAAWCVHVRAAG